jgi:hypothetical protein
MDRAQLIAPATGGRFLEEIKETSVAAIPLWNSFSFDSNSF